MLEGADSFKSALKGDLPFKNHWLAGKLILNNPLQGSCVEDVLSVKFENNWREGKYPMLAAFHDSAWRSAIAVMGRVLDVSARSETPAGFRV